MKCLWTTLGAMSLLLVTPVLAAEKKSDARSDARAPETKLGIGVASGELAPTQEMWFYE
jgi:hypothetical protein